MQIADLKYGLIILICCWAVNLDSAAAQGQNTDLQIEKIAVNDYSAPLNQSSWSSAMPLSEVGPSQTFYYLIRVTNLGEVSAEDISIRDWLPDEISGVAVPEPAEGILLQGNMVQVDIPGLEGDASRYLAIRAVSPQFAPATLYNYAYLTAYNDDNDSNNRCETRTYVRLHSYTRKDAIASFEDLLRSQADLLSGFKDLLHTVPVEQKECYQFIASYEQLLRSQNVLFSRFQELLYNSRQEGWDEDLLASDQIDFLDSYEDLLRREAGLYAGFAQKLDHCWKALGKDYRYDPDGPGGLPEHSTPAQREFLASFEDLLRREAVLFDGFQMLEQRLDSGVGYEDRVAFLSSFEDLLRRESDLLQGFEDLIMRLFLSI